MQGKQPTQPISELHLVRQASQVNCRFWCGTTYKGELSTSDLLANGDVDMALHDAASRGIQDPPPLLISDNDREDPFFLYFLQIEGDEAVQRSLGHLEGLLKGQNLDSLGIYIPKLNNQSIPTSSLYSRIVQELVQHLGLTKIFVLIEPSRYDQTLDELLHVKQHLETEKISLMVYH